MDANFTPGDLVRARGREWVVLSSPRNEVLKLRPLYGSENDTVILDRSLENLPVESAGFDLPEDAAITVQAKAVLLADAMRLTLRRGAGPFRSAAHLTFEPRIYQLVPLLMALRLQVPRLLIADDVGIGKTIEAGLILREFMDRGEVDAFSVLCPPHLVEQWGTELKSRFGIEAVAVTSSSAARLERNLPIGQTLFDAYPHTIVSLDYIKAERRRDSFARACPDFVIVDEAHTCVGTHRGKQQRFNLLEKLAESKERCLIMLTATPHSGDEDAFARLLALINPSFEEVSFEDEKYRINLARHFVQRRRADLVEEGWEKDGAFPKHKTKERPYSLSLEHIDFQKSVLDYCFDVVEKAGKEDTRERRLAFWSTLTLMRCVGSSPAAAQSALRNRVSNESDRLEFEIYDEDGDDENSGDIEPGPNFDADSELLSLIKQAQELADKPDQKLLTLIDDLKPLIKKGANPVVFCRYIATAKYVCENLRAKFPDIRVESVTGELTPDQRRDLVENMASTANGEKARHILVATDCLSEGINLQYLFNAVIHYDLSWNPVRHQQREGRVDRFGQPAKLVHSIMMFSPDSAIDGAVLKVILRKAEEIREATGVTVPLPDKRGPVTDALMASMMLREGSNREQMVLDLRLSDGTEVMDARWHDASENEKKSRTRFAQNAMKPQKVAPEWEKVRSLLGSPADVKSFVEQAMSCFGGSLESRHSILLAHVSALDNALKERLLEKGMENTIHLTIEEPAPAGATFLSRTHPLTTTLAEALVEASLDPESLPDLKLGRVGAWPTKCVQKKTQIVLLRIRYKLTVHAREKRLLLAEETALVAIEDGKIIVTGVEARKLLGTPAEADLASVASKRFTKEARDELQSLLEGPLKEFVQMRVDELEQDHSRLRVASKSAASSTSRVTVEDVKPPDVIGLFVLMPSAE